MVEHVAIMGLGLMGGSLGLALRRRGLVKSVRGYARREATRRMAIDREVVDAVYASPEEAVAGADLVVFCVPVLVIPELAGTCASAFAETVTVTDVGSTKADVHTAMASALGGRAHRFVGSHPIAGSESVGIEAAREGLYDGATVVITPDGAEEACVSVLGEFWSTLGSRVVHMGAVEHDRIVARTSHLPHLVAAALAGSVCRGQPEVVAPFCGSGFRDTTRIAGGSEDVWHDIVKTNRSAVNRELDRFVAELNRVRKMVTDEDFEALRVYLADCRRRREDVMAPMPEAPPGNTRGG